MDLVGVVVDFSSLDFPDHCISSDPVLDRTSMEIPVPLLNKSFDADGDPGRVGGVQSGCLFGEEMMISLRGGGDIIAPFDMDVVCFKDLGPGVVCDPLSKFSDG